MAAEPPEPTALAVVSVLAVPEGAYYELDFHLTMLNIFL